MVSKIQSAQDRTIVSYFPGEHVPLPAITVQFMALYTHCTFKKPKKSAPYLNPANAKCAVKTHCVVWWVICMFMSESYM